MATMRSEGIANITFAIAIVIIVLVVIRREFFTEPPTVGGTAAAPQLIDGWEASLQTGIRSGLEASHVQVVQYVDFQCSACRSYHRNIFDAITAEYGDKVGFTYVHFPLEFHEFAVPAAIASECADAQGVFEDFVEVLYSRQDEFGSVAWSEMAVSLEDVNERDFQACMEEPAVEDRVLAGRELGLALGVSGTPTILVNGWSTLSGPPSSSELTEAITQALEGNDPY